MSNDISIADRVTHANAGQIVTSAMPIHRLLETVMAKEFSDLSHHVVTTTKEEGQEVYVNDAGKPVVADEGSSGGSFVRHEDGCGCGRVSSSQVQRLVGQNKTEAPGAGQSVAGATGGGSGLHLCRSRNGSAGGGRARMRGKKKNWPVEIGSLPECSGIYLITCKSTGDTYI